MTLLSATDPRGHALTDICVETLARVLRVVRAGLDTGTAGKAVSDMQVRRLGVRECNGRALI